MTIIKIDGLWDQKGNVSYRMGDYFHCIFQLNKTPPPAWWYEFKTIEKTTPSQIIRSVRAYPDKIGIDMKMEDMSAALEHLEKVVSKTNEKYAVFTEKQAREEEKRQEIKIKRDREAEKFEQLLKNHFEKNES